MHPHARLSLGAALVLALGAGTSMTACSSLDGAEPEIPPLTSEPGDPAPGGAAPVSLPPKEDRAARVVLMKYLRGVGGGDTEVCAHLTPDYQRRTFGESGCTPASFAQARRRLRTEDLAALRGVTVPAGQGGPGPGELTVRFIDLEWRADPAVPGGVLAARFLLRKTGGRWLVAD